jgi:hypothetical protein
MSAELSSPSPHDPDRPEFDCSELPERCKRRFYFKLPHGRVVTITALWISKREWPYRPEARPGSPWCVWRLGPFLVALRVDG